MKKILYGLLLILCLVTACSYENDSLDQGTILGIDIRECSCCGGFFIDIKDSTYRFYSLPAGSEINLIDDPVFPIYVNVSWKMRDTLCLGDEIIILKIEPR